MDIFIMEPDLWDDVEKWCNDRRMYPKAFPPGRDGRLTFRDGMLRDDFKAALEEVKKLREEAVAMKRLPKLKASNVLRDLLPPLTQDQRHKLEKDILKNGVREPIVIWKGTKTIVDGHNRYKICARHNLPFETVEMEFENFRVAKMWMISNQIGRRNLTIIQRADLAAEYESLLQKARKAEKRAGMNHTKTDEPKERTRKVAAKAFDVGEETVAKMGRLKKSGDEKLQEAVKSGEVSLNAANKALQERAFAEKAKSGKAFNRTTDSIEWAKWSWNPHTGCLGPEGDGVLCEYCYAADMATRFSDIFHDFRPYFHADRLQAPFNTKIPELDKDLPGIHNVFLVSMGDMAWMDKYDRAKLLETLHRCAKERTRSKPKIPPWNFLLLTKVPGWIAKIDWPSNVWVGVTVDTQDRVGPAIKALSECNATVKFLSLEPMTEEISFTTGGLIEGLTYDKRLEAISDGKDFINGLSYVDWLIIGGRSKSSKLPAAQPSWKAVEKVLAQARQAGVKVYFKPNLTVRPQEYPK